MKSNKTNDNLKKVLRTNYSKSPEPLFLNNHKISSRNNRVNSSENKKTYNFQENSISKNINFISTDNIIHKNQQIYHPRKATLIFQNIKKKFLTKKKISKKSILKNERIFLNEKYRNNSNNSPEIQTNKLKNYNNNSNLKKNKNNRLITNETSTKKCNKYKNKNYPLKSSPNIYFTLYNNKQKLENIKLLNKSMVNPISEIKIIKKETKNQYRENIKRKKNYFNKLTERYINSFYNKINNVLVNYASYNTFNQLFSKKKYILLKILRKRNQNFKKLILKNYFYIWKIFNNTNDKKSENIFSENISNNNFILYEENDDLLLRFSLVKNKKFIVECLDTNNISNNKEMYSNHYNISEIINISENNDKLDIKLIFNILFKKHKPILKFNKTKDEYKLKIYLDNKITTLILKKGKCNDNEFIRINKEKKRILQFKKEQENIYNELISENKNLIEENEKLKKELEIIQNMNNKFEEIFKNINDIQINTLNQINNIYNKK